jgi:hypothetical protein
LGIEFLTVTIVFDLSNQHGVPLLMVLILHEEWIITHRYSFPFRMYHIFFTVCPKIKPYLTAKCPPAHISKCQNSANYDWWHKDCRMVLRSVPIMENSSSRASCIDVSNSRKQYQVVCWYTCFFIAYHLCMRWCTVVGQCVRLCAVGNISASLGVFRELLIKWLS